MPKNSGSGHRSHATFDAEAELTPALESAHAHALARAGDKDIFAVAGHLGMRI